MKLLWVVLMGLFGLGVYILLPQNSLPIIISEKEYICTLSDCKYKVLITNSSSSTHSAYLLVNAKTTGTKYSQAKVIEQRHEFMLSSKETMVVEDKITVPMARGMYFLVGVNRQTE
jgi:hypothetical protein